MDTQHEAPLGASAPLEPHALRPGVRGTSGGEAKRAVRAARLASKSLGRPAAGLGWGALTRGTLVAALLGRSASRALRPAAGLGWGALTGGTLAAARGAKRGTPRGASLAGRDARKSEGGRTNDATLLLVRGLVPCWGAGLAERDVREPEGGRTDDAALLLRARGLVPYWSTTGYSLWSTSARLVVGGPGRVGVSTTAHSLL